MSDKPPAPVVQQPQPGGLFEPGFVWTRPSPGLNRVEFFIEPKTDEEITEITERLLSY